MGSFERYYYAEEYYTDVSTHCDNCEKDVELTDVQVRGGWYDEDCPNCKKSINREVRD